eukprot:6056668-Prymnesium_polylepis.1
MGTGRNGGRGGEGGDGGDKGGAGGKNGELHQVSPMEQTVSLMPSQLGVPVTCNTQVELETASSIAVTVLPRQPVESSGAFLGQHL